MNRDELEGKAEALKGKVKKAAGDLTDNPDLHDEGAVDRVLGQQLAKHLLAVVAPRSGRHRAGDEDVTADDPNVDVLRGHPFVVCELVPDVGHEVLRRLGIGRHPLDLPQRGPAHSPKQLQILVRERRRWDTDLSAFE